MDKNQDNVEITELSRLITKKKKLTTGLVWWFVYPILTFMIFLLISLSADFKNESEDLFVLFIVSIILSIIFIKPSIQFFISDNIDGKIINLSISSQSEQLKNSSENKDFFSELVSINFKYIDQYYQQTQSQANKSFYLAAAAAVTGFLLICIGIFLMYSGHITSAYIAAITGVISEFISSVFFYLYNKTISKMSNYHKKLVLTQNISLALKTTEELSGNKKEDVLEHIIKELTTNINKYLIEEYNQTSNKNKTLKHPN